MRLIMPIASVFVVLASNAGCATAIAGTPAFELHGGDFDNLRGEYAMADGRVARIVGTRRHPQLDLDDGPVRALLALSATELVSADGCLHVTFEAHANASVTRLRLSRASACALH